MSDLNRDMAGLVNSKQLWEDFGVFTTNFQDTDGLSNLIELFQMENPDYRLAAVNMGSSQNLGQWEHGSVLLGHNSNNGVFSLLDFNGRPYINHDEGTVALIATPNDSLYIVPNGTAEVLEGRLVGLRLGYRRQDAFAEGYNHHLPSDQLAIDPVLPEFGCGEKKNHYTTMSVYQGGKGRILHGNPRLRELPSDKLEPNLSQIYGAHFVSPAKSRVHSHFIGEIYFGGDGVLFVYDHELNNARAIELGPDTVLYLSKLHKGWPPKHGAVAGDLGHPKGVWVAVPGEWQAETFYDTPNDIALTRQHSGISFIHPGTFIGDRLPRPLNGEGQKFAAEEFMYSQR